MTARNEPSAQSLFGDATLDETARLKVVLARFEGAARTSFEELIEGYSSMKVLTYSSSTSIINRAAGELEKLEIVFGRHDRVREELLQQWLHDPAAWSRRGDKIVFRSEDIHGTVAKLRRDVPDYLYGTGSKGNVIVFEREELERFLDVSMFSKKSPFGALTRLFGGKGG